MTLKVTGNSWFWNFEYPDLGVSHRRQLAAGRRIARARTGPADICLATTEPLFVPVGANVRVLVTSNDVIHAFAVPAFGVKEDAIQGRVNETWFNVDRRGRLLRPVLGIVRHEPRLHADRNSRREPRGI